ncbi:MAG: hypothetical protein ACREUA_00840 [Burkholderiales bacterium]
MTKIFASGATLRALRIAESQAPRVCNKGARWSLASAVLVLAYASGAYADLFTTRECKEATHKAEFNSRDLEQASKSLAECVALRDYQNPCKREYAKVKEEYNYYESAAAKAAFECLQKFERPN